MLFVLRNLCLPQVNKDVLRFLQNLYNFRFYFYIYDPFQVENFPRVTTGSCFLGAYLWKNSGFTTIFWGLPFTHSITFVIKQLCQSDIEEMQMKTIMRCYFIPTMMAIIIIIVIIIKHKFWWGCGEIRTSIYYC